MEGGREGGRWWIGVVVQCALWRPGCVATDRPLGWHSHSVSQLVAHAVSYCQRRPPSAQQQQQQCHIVSSCCKCGASDCCCCADRLTAAFVINLPTVVNGPSSRQRRRLLLWRRRWVLPLFHLWRASNKADRRCYAMLEDLAEFDQFFSVDKSCNLWQILERLICVNTSCWYQYLRRLYYSTFICENASFISRYFIREFFDDRI